MKAQFWSFDIIFAIVIFLAAIVLLTYAWASISSQFTLANGNNAESLQYELQGFATTLLSTGTPNSWNLMVNPQDSSTWHNISIGLGNGNNGHVSNAKVMALMAMSNTDYQGTKQALGINFDYYIIFKGTNFYLSMGRNPAFYNATSVQVYNQPVIINGLQTQMQIELWTNSTFGVA